MSKLAVFAKCDRNLTTIAKVGYKEEVKNGIRADSIE